MRAPATTVGAPRYTVGQRVFVRAEWPEALQYQHIRTPSYARGHHGIVEKCFGAFPNPEDLAFGRPAARKFLYHVAFDRSDIWPTTPAALSADSDTFSAPAKDVVLIELYEHWLEDENSR